MKRQINSTISDYSGSKRTKLSQESESLQKIESSLKENFKLSSYEARAYLALLRRGKQSPKQIS
ncbi:MAG TPA: hypothetical protein VNE86_05710, partial [Nitrososphaerales archaeon]|nr:hypothetical protein [Nitrososphaerales archaeon]